MRTVHPDGSEQRVVFGVPASPADPDTVAPTPWETYRYDANDNAGRTHPATSGDFRSHWNTPASTEVDALGRTVLSVARNSAGPKTPDGGWYSTRSTYDIQGNLLSTVDATGRLVAQYTADLAGRRWRIDSADGGRRDTVHDALGNPIEVRDSTGALSLASFDLLHRPSRVWSRDGAAGPVTLRRLTEYGDGGSPAQPAPQHQAALAANLLGLRGRVR